MRFSEDTRFPHPVLWSETGDFKDGSFDMKLTSHEDLKTGALTIDHEITLSEDSIKDLVESGRAAVGCFIRCEDTYHTELRVLAWPSGQSDFAAGSLLNRVYLRPLIWLKEDLPDWNPGTIHPEFAPPISLHRGDVIALSDEHIISVGQAKLAPLESIFELDHSPEVQEGKLEIELDRDRITIVTGEKTHESILILREQARGKPVVMNSVYLPAVMEVLDALHAGGEQYATQRWYNTFIARCDARGVDPSVGASILENAQKLLNYPEALLLQLASEAE